MSFLDPLLDPDSPVQRLLKEYNSKYRQFFDRAESLGAISANHHLRDAIASEKHHCAQQIFSTAPSDHHLIEMRNRLLELPEKSPRDIQILGNVSLFLFDFYTASLCYSDLLAHDTELSPGQCYLVSIALTHFRSWATVVSLLSPIVQALAAPYRSDAFFRLGLAFKNLRHWDDALTCFKNTLLKPPPWLSKSDVSVEISQVYFAAGNVPMALAPLEQAFVVTPAVLQQQALLLLCTDDPARIEAGITALAEHKATPSSAHLLYLRGRLLYKARRLEESFQALSESLALDFENPLVWCALGNVYIRMRQIPDAVTCYQRAILQDRDMTEAWINYAACVELDPAIRERTKYFDMKFEDAPVFIRPRSRIDLDQAGLTKIPTIVEPNDRDRFPPSAALVEEIYAMEMPIVNVEVIEDEELLTEARQVAIEEGRREAAAREDDAAVEEAPSQGDSDASDESESEAESGDSQNDEDEAAGDHQEENDE
jgi:tetratricopeptide (TPR) repeat protein